MVTRILVVDDAEFARVRARRLLMENGYDVDEAVNGKEAVEKYLSFQPDVVMMDITMPVLDGLDALREIKRTDPQAKVIMCSALGQQSMVLEAIKAGARDFIVKPFEPERILSAVKKQVG